MRKKNYFAGPSVLPIEVLEEMRDNIVDYRKYLYFDVEEDFG